LARPSSFIVAGSSTARTIVASIRTAIARLKPICCIMIRLSVANSPKTATMTSAALVMMRADCVSPSATARSLSPWAL